MSEGIFISYRRDDSRHAAGRLADELIKAFGADSIFRDIEGIELGTDFTDSLEKALARCSVMLVLIGRNWLDIRDETGARRLDDPKDWIRQEIATALRRKVRVIPVLLEGVCRPVASELPEDIRDMVGRQELEISDARWRGDMQRLVEALAKVPGFTRLDDQDSTPDKRAKSRNKSIWAWVSASIVLLLAVVVWEGEQPDPGPAPWTNSGAQGFPSGHGMKVCGCWGPNPPRTEPEPKCLSGLVRVNVCAGSCGPGHPQYAYVCQ